MWLLKGVLIGVGTFLILSVLYLCGCFGLSILGPLNCIRGNSLHQLT
jgi:hypothetical protein